MSDLAKRVAERLRDYELLIDARVADVIEAAQAIPPAYSEFLGREAARAIAAPINLEVKP